MRSYANKSLGAAVLAAALCLASCGIEDYEYLYSPYEYSSGKTLIIKHNTQNQSSSSFLGYQLYYKIYLGDSTSTPPTAATTDAATIEANWSDIYPDVIMKRITDAGYVTMVSSNDLSSSVVTSATEKADPFLAISSTELTKTVLATLDLASDSGTWKKNVDGVDTEYYLRRRATSSSSDEYLSFTDYEYSTKDCDTTTSGTVYWLRAYAVAYGFSSDWTPFYSTPTRATSSTFSYDTLCLNP